MMNLLNKIRFRCKQGSVTAMVCFKQKFEGGFFKNIAENMVYLVQFVVFVLIWKGLAGAGVDLQGMTEESLLTYTLLSFACRRQLNILTPATSALWEGSVVRYYTRPMHVYMTYAAETVGKFWLPSALFFALPLVLFSSLLGINPLPASPASGLLFLVSMLLSIALGYGIDILFIALAIRMKNAVWAATHIRESIYNLLSGALIPFALFPTSVAYVFSLLPFGSIANAPLMLYIGQGDPARLLPLQAFWAVAIWLVAHWAYRRSEERMISYGG